MKSCALLVLTVACLVFQQVSSRPEKSMQDKAQEMMDRVKAGAHEYMEQAQEAASRAVESAKAAVHDAMQAAQEAKQHGLETGREWVEYGKSVAATFSNQTVVEKVDKEME